MNIPSLKAFVVCRDVLLNSRASSVISIIDIFNELRISRFPAQIGTIALVALYGGAVGEFSHRFEMWEKGMLIGNIPEQTFFLEDINAVFHTVTHLDGVFAEEPRHLTFKAICNGVEAGTATLGIFKPLKGDEPPEELRES